VVVGRIGFQSDRNTVDTGFLVTEPEAVRGDAGDRETTFLCPVPQAVLGSLLGAVDL
jgi:hypothetical protein